jgi:uncharacterized protein (TIGR00369 family)
MSDEKTNAFGDTGVQIDDLELAAEFAKLKGVFAAQTAAIGLKIARIERGKAWSRIDWREDLVGDAETAVIAGGVLTTMLDSTCGAACQAALGKLTPMATLDLRIDYMRPAEPRRLINAMAHCYKITRSVCFVRGVAYHDDPDDPIATAACTFMLTTEESYGAEVTVA